MNHNDCHKEFCEQRPLLASIGLKLSNVGRAQPEPLARDARTIGYTVRCVLPTGTVYRWEGNACCGWDAKTQAAQKLDKLMPKIDKHMPKRGPAKAITIEQYHQAESDMSGFCLDCGAEAYNVEPDARGYACESCNAHRVFGAQEMLLMGLVK